MRPTRRTFLAGTSALALAPLLAACGSDGATSTETDASNNLPATTVPTDEAAFPATITHKFGETTVTKAPERVVCVGLVEQDALLALGIVPVAVTYWFGEADGQIFPWATDALGDAKVPVVLDPTNGTPVEKIAKLKPDLIIGQYAGLTKAEYDLLSKLAPTIAQPGEYADYGVPWEEATLTIGTAIGKPTAAQTLIDEVKATVQAAADAHPEFAGQSAMVVTPYEGLFIYGPEDPRSRMLVDLGFVFPEAFADQKAEFGVSLSSERTSELADLGAVVWLDYAADKSVQSVFEKTTAYTEGRWFDISADNGAYYVAHSMVTPLSIPYVLERYVPQLAAAVDGDVATKVPVVED